MGSSPFFPTFLLITFTIMVKGDHNCPSSMCSDKDLDIQFPFSFTGAQQDRCGYPGFDLSCDKTNKTVLQLGSSGEFFIRAIEYDTQEIQIYDQHNCLPKRLMNLNLSGTPFMGSYTQDLNFFNCSSNFSLDTIEVISCLSSANYTVYASSFTGRTRYMPTGCQLIASVAVPTQWPFYELAFYDDIYLTWTVPDCIECLQRGGKCEFKNNNSNDIKCSHIRRHGLSKAVTYILTIGVGVPILICLILVACYICGRFKIYGANRHHHRRRHFESSVLPQPAICVVGLDESVIQSYPKTVLGESRRLEKPDDNTCPICLSEYRPKETLRTIPDCKHCFHATCIDEWLRKNSTCPLCRNSPLPVSPPV